MKIYIVECSSYGDFDILQTRSVRGFKSEAAAESFCEKCNSSIKGCDDWSWEKRNSFKHPLDSKFSVYGGSTKYQVKTLGYEDY